MSYPERLKTFVQPGVQGSFQVEVFHALPSGAGGGETQGTPLKPRQGPRPWTPLQKPIPERRREEELRGHP